MTEMEKLFEKMLNMELTNEEMFEQCRNVAHEPMTNEEYLRSAGTDGITAIFMQFMFDAEFKARFVNGNFITEFRKWLKEKHE